jgi:AhpD family alkylhydroperoxidase
MITRIDYYKVFPEGISTMIKLEELVNSFGLEKSLIDIVKIRASQINGCAFCVDMHCTEARKAGESERRINALAVWQESTFFTQRERAALAWTEAVTLLPQTHAPDDIYQEVLKSYNEKEMVNLTMAIIMINSWNRLAVSFREIPKH